MPNLSTSYLGLELRNPIVVSSSSLTKNLENVQACAEAGAGAVQLKSLFEEEIEATIMDLERNPSGHTEAMDYIRSVQTSFNLDSYKKLIRDAKKSTSVPIIASINAVSSEWWVNQVKSLEEAGADALELNISLLPHDYHDSEEKIIKFYLDTVEAVRKEVKLPIAVKIGHYFTSIPALAEKLRWKGADGLVLFNRFYQLDIDTEAQALSAGSPISSPSDLAIPLRWVSLLYGKTDLQLAASGGIHDGNAAVKVVLAGAQVAQVCSALYKNKIGYLKTMVADFEAWMEKHNYSSVEQFRGKLSQSHSDRPQNYERLQYIRTLVGHDK